MNPIIIDNVLPYSLADEIELMLTDDNFPWYYVPDVTYSADKIGKFIPGFQHRYYNPDEGVTSSFFPLVSCIPHIVFNKLNYDVTPKVIRCKSFLQLPLIRDNKYEHNSRHIDLPFPHTVCLYYANDTDGDTFIYDNQNKTLIQQVTPRKNRVVIFDGMCYHASSLPTIHKRIIINFDVEAK